VPWGSIEKIMIDMKKKIGFAMLAVCLLMLGGCQKELSGVGGGSAVKTAFTVLIPVESATKVVSHVSQAEKTDVVYYEVWDEDFTERLFPYEGSEENSATVIGGTTEIMIDLVKDQTFNLIFWAQNKNCGAYSWENLKNVDVDYTKFTADQKDVYDAFYAVLEDVYADGNSRTIYLYRPFAQVNFCATQMSTTMGQIVPSGNTVTVSNVASTFNTVSGMALNPVGPVTFTSGAGMVEDEVLEVDGDDLTWLAMNYLLVPSATSDNPSIITTVTASFATNFGTVEHTVYNVPIQKNYRTNIVGDLFGSETNFKIVVRPDFEKPDYNESGLPEDDENNN
jgi:hypothetical protein